ncbi:hypothetical protein EKO27_g202 [Xylaria grammica]|uniref:AVL9/DENND6 domain-containing protein n=1 Tax=Xylaria grammica TaxID=363999 RepID=A0A439DKL2_9PEZI|nr:hypothetical protein EKO27_g202 [Xylaria grammica]
MASPTGDAAGNGDAGRTGFVPLVAVVDFHHHRGPEVERWFGVSEGRDPAVEWDWTLLPFMALSDGAHASTEDFSYFTLVRPATDDSPATSLFGISCTRQMDAAQLLVRPPDVTRSTVQKAVVVIADTPQFFGMLRERLSVVTSAWFAQREFTDTEILRRFQDSLADEKDRGQLSEEVDRDQYLGMSLRELGSLFGPYTPLQQLDLLADFGTKSYIVGSTNSLLLQQKDRYSDILINLDEDTINVTSPSLRNALALSHSDRRWIDFITQEVNDTWDDANPQRPKTMGYRGSEEFIRLQFEEYLLSLISAVKYRNYLVQNAWNPKATLPYIEGDPSQDFGNEWVEYWMRTENYRLWNKNTDSHLFDIVEPRHPCAGGLSIDDVQRRIQQQVQDLHLDERFAVGKEVLGRNLAAGREKASTLFNKFYADMEALREAQRKRAEESKTEQLDAEKNGQQGDVSKVQTASSVGSRAGAYIGSWTSWAGQKRKDGWGRSSNSNGSSGGGWGFGSVRKSRNATSNNIMSDTASEKNGTPLSSPAPSTSGFASTEKAPANSMPRRQSDANDESRPVTQHSFSESVLDGVESAEESGSSNPPSPRKPRVSHQDITVATTMKEGRESSDEKLPDAH